MQPKLTIGMAHFDDYDGLYFTIQALRLYHAEAMKDVELVVIDNNPESPHGKMEDRLYCIVAIRLQPKLKKGGAVDRYASGERKGEIKTQKIRFFREPVKRDFEALTLAKKTLDEKWDYFEKLDLIPTEQFPDGNDMRPRIYGMPRFARGPSLETERTVEIE